MSDNPANVAPVANLFDGLPDRLPDEVVNILHESPGVRIERIVSHGHASPPGFWYDQPRDEWVVVLRGAARLQIEGVDGLIEMNPGDYVHIPAHKRHRVEWTTPEGPTIWLAVHGGLSG